MKNIIPILIAFTVVGIAAHAQDTKPAAPQTGTEAQSSAAREIPVEELLGRLDALSHQESVRGKDLDALVKSLEAIIHQPLPPAKAPEPAKDESRDVETLAKKLEASTSVAANSTVSMPASTPTAGNNTDNTAIKKNEPAGDDEGGRPEPGWRDRLEKTFPSTPGTKE